MDKLLLPRRQNAFFFTFPNASFLTLISKLSSKSVYLVFLLLGATVMLNAQVWNKLTPSPTITDGLIGIHFIDDAGSTWTTETINPAVVPRLVRLALPCPSVFYACGLNGTVLDLL